MLAHENVLNRVSAPTGQQSPFPIGIWPTETYIARIKSMYLNNDGIQVMHQPAAHSDGDSIVLFRRADVIATGDILDLRQFPVIDAAAGGSVQGELDALNQLIDLAIPAVPLLHKEGRTYLVPGHGRISDQADLVEYRDMVTVIRDRIKSMVDKGLTLAQVKAANPTLGYRGGTVPTPGRGRPTCSWRLSTTACVGQGDPDRMSFRSMVVAILAALMLTAAPASAQVDLTGSWASRMHEDFFERGPGRDLGDYTGAPLNDEARAIALSYEPTLLAMRERQCLPYSPYAWPYQPGGFRMWSEFDADGRIIAWKTAAGTIRDMLIIWMDGRPHPSANAFSATTGFTTGKWEGNTLTTYTTNLKAHVFRRGNGLPASDRTTITAHFTRHDNLLTITTIEEDPDLSDRAARRQPHLGARPHGGHPALDGLQPGDRDSQARRHRSRAASSPWPDSV